MDKNLLKDNNMNKIILVLVLPILSLYVRAQVPCDYRMLLTTGKILEKLSQKPVEISFTNFVEHCNVDDSVRRRIIELLHWEWTEMEVENYVEGYFMEYESFLKVKENAQKLSKGDDSLYKRVYDSIKTSIKDEERKQISKQFGVKGGIILSSAWLYLSEAKPILRAALFDSTHYNRSEVALALARLGDKQLQKKIIGSCTYRKELEGFEWLAYFEDKIARKLIFTSTQESIYKLNEWFDTSKTYKPRSDGKVTVKTSVNMIIVLKYLLKNKDLQAKIRYIDEDLLSKGFTDNSLILFCKEWLKKNKGRYQINKSWCPY
jgi:hypothetical protein